jgi:hypothetical protein
MGPVGCHIIPLRANTYSRRLPFRGTAGCIYCGAQQPSDRSMNEDPELFRYLRSAYRIIREPSLLLLGEYREHFGILLQTLQAVVPRFVADSRFFFKPLDDVRLTVVYSADRVCTVVQILGTKHLIYDQYLGQTFSTLTRLFLHANPVQIRHFGLKLYAEAFHRRGDLRNAFHCAMAYQHKRTRMTDDASLSFLRQRLNFVQESFIMAHELAHLLVHECRHDYREQIRNWLLCHIDFYADQAMILDSFRFCKDLSSDPSVQRYLDDGIQSTIAMGCTGHLQVRSKMERLVADDDFIKEVFCDHIASLTVWAYAELRGISAGDLIKGIGLTLHHLHLLDVCNAFVDLGFDEGRMEAENEKLGMRSMMRLMALQMISADWLPMLARTMRHSSHALAALCQDAQYERVLEEPILDDLGPRMLSWLAEQDKALERDGADLGVIPFPALDDLFKQLLFNSISPQDILAAVFLLGGTN